MQLEYKVIRLQRQAIDVNYSYLLEEMSPDEVVPYLVQRRLLTQTQAAEVWEKSSRLDKVYHIVIVLRKLNVGIFPTFCAALTSAGQLHITERLLNSEFNYDSLYIYAWNTSNLEPHILSIIVGRPLWRGCIDVNGKTIGTHKFVHYIEVSVIEGCPLSGVPL